MKNGEAPNLSPTHLATYKPGPYCATCGSIKVIRQRGAMLYRCKTMGKDFSPFEDNSLWACKDPPAGKRVAMNRMP